jgi:hypothetical protein
VQPLKTAREPSAVTIDLAIAYRVYPRVSPTPALYPDNKFKLVEACLGSFKRALGSLRIKMWVLLDGCPPFYEELFRANFREEEIEVIHLDSVGNEATFAMQVDLLSSQTVADLVYFAEDDYFYLPGAMVELVEFARKGGAVDFITPYDHPDRYENSTRTQRSLVSNFGGRHWRTTSSTCLTFLAVRTALVMNRSLFKAFRCGDDDCAIWQAVTEGSSLFNFRVHAATSLRIKIWIKTWLYGYKRIMFRRPCQLWSPLPSVATHMALPLLAPAVDWYSEFDRFSHREGTASGLNSSPLAETECDRA